MFHPSLTYLFKDNFEINMCEGGMLNRPKRVRDYGYIERMKISFLMAQR